MSAMDRAWTNMMNVAGKLHVRLDARGRLKRHKHKRARAKS